MKLAPALNIIAAPVAAAILVTGLAAAPAAAQDKEPIYKKGDAARLMKTWRRAHLRQESAALQARISNLRYLRAKTGGEAVPQPQLAELEGKARQAFLEMRRRQKLAAGAFIESGRALDAVIEARPDDAELHAWRAELFASLAASGRSIGEALGPKPPGLLSYRLFEKGLGSALTALEARPADPQRRALAARLLAVFNRFDEALDTLGEAREGEQAEGRLLRATLRYYKGEIGPARALVDGLPADEKEAPAAVELAKVLEHAAAMSRRAAKLDEATKASAPRPRVKLEIDGKAAIIELFEDEAPNTVANFIALVEAGFYDGLRFHRVLSNFIAQVGDPKSRDSEEVDGRGGPGWKIKDEIHAKSYPHLRGMVAMARGADKDSAGSQFYVSQVPLPYLDGQSTVFGRVVEGLEIFDRIRAGARLTRASVLRKRPHAYAPKKMAEKE